VGNSGDSGSFLVCHSRKKIIFAEAKRIRLRRRKRALLFPIRAKAPSIWTLFALSNSGTVAA